MNLDWYYDFNMLLRRIEVPGVPSEKFQMAGVPAKVLTQTRSNPDELVCFGCPDFINTSKPVSMGQDDYQNSSCGSVRTEIMEVRVMTQVRYFGFVKAEEPWTGNQFKMYAGKNGSTFGSKVPAGSVVECGYKSISSADSAARELKSRCEKMGRRVFCWGYESVAEVQ